MIQVALTVMAFHFMRGKLEVFSIFSTWTFKIYSLGIGLTFRP